VDAHRAASRCARRPAPVRGAASRGDSFGRPVGRLVYTRGAGGRCCARQWPAYRGRMDSRYARAPCHEGQVYGVRALPASDPFCVERRSPPREWPFIMRGAPAPC